MAIKVNNINVIDDSRQLNVTGVSTLSTALVSDLNVTGVSTLGTLQISSGIVTATSGIVTYYGDGQYLEGIAAGGSGQFKFLAQLSFRNGFI